MREAENNTRTDRVSVCSPDEPGAAFGTHAHFQTQICEMITGSFEWESNPRPFSV